MKYGLLALFAALSCIPAARVNADTITLIRDGKSAAAIHVAPEYMEVRAADPNASREEVERAAGRARVRESVKDLADYLGKLTGATVPIHVRPPTPDDPSIPLLIGGYADERFGPFNKPTEFKQGYRLVVSAKGVGFQGETDEGVSYAIYELLDSLGCRWFIPGELGEYVPRLNAILLDEQDVQAVPRTVSRQVTYADDAFRRRNRLGGFPFTAGHALESYVTKQQLEEHLSWNAEIGGKRGLQPCDVGFRLCWASAEAAAAVGDKIIARLDQQYAPCVSISPGDGVNFCECAECKRLDADDYDPSMSCISITDRYIHFSNQIAERVAEKYPEVRLGFLAYVQYTRPPVREKLHRALIPQLAPISYCRAHTLDDPTCESRQRIRYLLEGWGKVTKNIAMYEYYFHLAEVAAPFPAIQRNVVELPIQYENHVTMWTPETMPNFESFMPGLYLGMRMAWRSADTPRDILDDYYTHFYGAAAKPMEAYWQFVDDCWTTVPEHSGCGFSYLRRFTAEKMAAARTKMDAALSACQTPLETRRVQLADDSLRQHELFMKMRRNYFAGQFAELGSDGQRWIATHQSLAEKYQDNFTFTKTGWAPETISVLYFKAFYNNSYRDVNRIANDFAILTGPVLAWKHAVDWKKEGEEQGWHKVDLDDKAWQQTDVSRETWATLGLAEYFGPVWYRAQVKLPELPPGKKVFLWVGATDGACKVFLNGQHVPYLNAKGEQVAEADGFCEPFSFDITSAIQSGADNQVTIRGTRNVLNELGTGGLLGPVLIYREK